MRFTDNRSDSGGFRNSDGSSAEDCSAGGSELPPKDRKLIVLRYFGGKTQTETADVLGMTQVQVSRREKVILRELRKQLTG